MRVLILFVVRAAGGLTCPSWCVDFICDGSAWCQHGERPAPCADCELDSVEVSTHFVGGSTFEITIPPYVGAGNVREAREHCAKEGGRLASITNRTVNQAALELMLKYKRDRATIGASKGNANWAWPNLDPQWSFENWARGQPDSQEDECAEMWTTGEWNDVPCGDGPRAYLCQVPVPPADFTFPCSVSVTRSIGRAATCRYVVSATSSEEKKDIFWKQALDKCKALGGGSQLAEPRTAEQNQVRQLK